MNPNKSSYAKIELNLGGSLQELVLHHKSIIKDNIKVPYSESYASSILFPFVNRIKDGKYTFENSDFTLEKNLIDEGNALHGLIYNKTFEYVENETSHDFCSITLKYDEVELAQGFPYTYTLHMTYILTNESLQLKVTIKNTDQNAFPFNIGWHPYFISSNLYDSFLKLNSNEKLSFNDSLILNTNEVVSLFDYFKIEDTTFDDCFVLKNNTIHFKTPDYSIQLNSSNDANFLQIYSPSNRQSIALEPMTGFANSFNNNDGFQVLNPNETYAISWAIKLKTSKT